jgi:RHS repeat-associated protein
VSYTPFNKPGHITRGSASVTIAYGPNRARYERLDSDATDTTRTRYLGSVEEIVEHLGGSEVHKLKRYLPGGVVMTEIGLTTEQRYLFGDHLGSTNLVLDEAGSVVQRMAFDAFGRRAAAGDNPTPVLWASLAESLIWGFNTDATTKGFTGHEHLDGVGLIHMNGRVYDPAVGRFLSADPFVQAPSNTQSLNRYSYVLNNPLSYTDPIGYIFKSIINSLGRKAGAIGGLVQLFGALSGQFWLTVAAGTVGNGIAEGSLSGALRGAFNAALGHQLGAAFGKKHTLRTLAGTAVSRGIESELNGGQFVRGFAATVLPPLIAKASSGGGAVRRTLAALVAGGSRSALQGHRFANGAATAAFGLALAGGQDGSPGTGASAGATLAAGAAAADTEAEAGLGALVSAADEAWMRIDQYIAAHPGEHVVVAREDFEAIFEADLRLARSLRLESVPVDRHETYLENASSDTLWFEEEYKDLFFHIEGVGRAHGADINYYGVGMTFAGFGYSEAYLRTGVIGWNAIQWWERDFASREVRQMQTGQFWAMRGYRAYNAGRD